MADEQPVWRSRICGLRSFIRNALCDAEKIELLALLKCSGLRVTPVADESMMISVPFPTSTDFMVFCGAWFTRALGVPALRMLGFGKRVALACLLERREALSPLRSFTATSWLLAPDYVNASFVRIEMRFTLIWFHFFWCDLRSKC